MAAKDKTTQPTRRHVAVRRAAELALRRGEAFVVEYHCPVVAGTRWGAVAAPLPLASCRAHYLHIHFATPRGGNDDSRR